MKFRAHALNLTTQGRQLCTWRNKTVKKHLHLKSSVNKNKNKNVVLEMLHIVQRIVDKYFILLLLCFYPKPVILLS